MERERVLRTAHAFIGALARQDAGGAWRLFADDSPSYADPVKVGRSVGTEAVRQHMHALCDGLRGATVTPLDVLVDHESACVRWMAEVPGRDPPVLDAVTWMRLGEGGIEEARSFFDGVIYQPGTDPPSSPRQPAVPSTTVVTDAPGQPALRGQDHRGRTFSMEQLRGRCAAVLVVSRAVHAQAQEVAEQLGEAFAGDARVGLVLLLDGSDVPGALRGVARSALGTLGAHVQRRFQASWEEKGRAPGAELERLLHLVPDWTGALLDELGAPRPLAEPLLVVVDAEGRVRGRHQGAPEQVAAAAVAELRGLVASVPPPGG